jgi:hypothetical protein
LEWSALGRRAADTLDRSAELAEWNVERVRRNGQAELAAIERERAMRAREAADAGGRWLRNCNDESEMLLVPGFRVAARSLRLVWVMPGGGPVAELFRMAVVIGRHAPPLPASSNGSCSPESARA